MLQHALLTPDSPLEKTPHKARNGELSITCRNRHCPKCQAQARQRWLAAREKELLGVSYFHVVFTLPHELIPLCQYNPKVLYTLLFQATAATLLEIAADPKHLGSFALRNSRGWHFSRPYALGAS